MDENRIKHLETMVGRLARRARRKASALFTPYPISTCLTGNVEGEVLRYLFCANGIVSRCMIVLDKRPSAGIKLTISLNNETGGKSASFITSKKSSIFKSDIDVSVGDKLIVTSEKIDPEKDDINELWLGFLWIPTVKDLHVKSFLIDELEKQDDLLQE